MDIKVPEEIAYIIGVLEENGHEAYIVGGCVRDAVLGDEPKDWDVCTSSLPAQTMQCFEGCQIIETGLRHGTITLVINHKPFEITTYRIDGAYSDNRRPDEVRFVADIKDDLSRRDFTINAMAYHPNKGFVDFFGGMQDIHNRVIRCVGDADKRFQEDALRIMRAMRFASVLSSDIEKGTSDAIFRNKNLLANIAVERISGEINKLITGRNASNVLLLYAQVIAEIIPEIKAMIGFAQNNPYHIADVWGHTIMSISNAPADAVMRLSMLFHDIAKPKCYSEVDSIGHFYGHPQVSSVMAKEILSRMKYDNATVDAVAQLVLYHDADIQPQKNHIKRWLNRLGEEKFRLLLGVKRADAMAQSEIFRQSKIKAINEITPILNEIIEQQQCFSLKDLSINGRDLIAAGVPEGKEIGNILNRLLEMVIDDQIVNDRESLMGALHDIL